MALTKASGPGRAARPDKTPVAKPAERPKRRRSIQYVSEEGPASRYWRDYFLEKLAETSNVTASADHARITPSRAYQARREDPDFARAWLAALYEGYQHLELEVLGFLRCQEPDRKFDVANAIRLLAAHRATIAQERAAIDDQDEQTVLNSIDAMIDEMRERSIVNTAQLEGPVDADETDQA